MSTEELAPLLLEHTSGCCNILHVLSLMGQPPNPAHSQSSASSAAAADRPGMAARTTPRGGVLREIIKQAMALARGSAPPNLGEGEAGVREKGRSYMYMYTLLV